MKVFLTIALVLALAAPAHSDPAPGNKPKPMDDNESITGTWKLTEIEMSHNSRPPGSDEKWVIGKDRIEWKGRLRPVAFSYSLDPSKAPKQIDLQIVEGLGTGAKIKGIYKLTEGKLQVCYFLNPENDERPTEFAGTDKLGGAVPANPVFLILRRSAPAGE